VTEYIPRCHTLAKWNNSNFSATYTDLVQAQCDYCKSAVSYTAQFILDNILSDSTVDGMSKSVCAVLPKAVSMFCPSVMKSMLTEQIAAVADDPTSTCEMVGLC
ncbi:unnamed protein product, partial [Phyllotreta striolata]